MMQSKNNNFLIIVPVIIISLILACMLNVYPLSASMAMYRPSILMMVLLFWVIYQPKFVGLIVAFLIGLAADLLFDTTLGQQGLCTVLMLLALRSMINSLNQTPYDAPVGFFIAWMFASVSLIVFQLTLWMLQFTMQNVFLIESMYGLILSIVTWPLVYIMLVGLRDNSFD